MWEIDVSGKGVYPELQVVQSYVNFGKVNIYQNKKKQVQLSNVGSAPLEILDLAVSTNVFSVNSLSITLQPNEEYPVDISFSPADTGNFQDSLMVLTNGNQEVINLEGTGIAPQLKVESTSNDFGKIFIGDSALCNVDIINNGNATLLISRIWIADSISFRPQFISSVAAYSSTQIGVWFYPTVSQSYHDTLYIETNAGISKISLSGEGIPAPLILSANYFDFGTVRVNQFSEPWTLTLKNPGTSSLILSKFSGKLPDIFIVSSIDSLIPAGDSLSYEFRFRPRSTKTYRDTLVIRTDYYENQVVFTGQGISPEIVLTDSVLNFGDVEIGSVQKVTFEILNPGSDMLQITSIKNKLTEFVVNPTQCTILPDEKKDITVEFKPPHYSFSSN